MKKLITKFCVWFLKDQNEIVDPIKDNFLKMPILDYEELDSNCQCSIYPIINNEAYNGFYDLEIKALISESDKDYIIMCFHKNNGIIPIKANSLLY